MTLSEFVLARIAEDETAAREGLTEGVYIAYADFVAAEVVAMARAEGVSERGLEHVERWMPARVLAECEAKRQIVAECIESDEEGTSGGVLARRVLHLLTLPYANHPDYREEWRRWRP